MLNLFSQGGPLFMGILTLLLIGLIVFTIRAFLQTNTSAEDSTYTNEISRMKFIATLALVTGILGQLIGLYSAFNFLESANAVAPNILAGGLKISLITTMYGILIYSIYLLLRFLLNLKNS